mmetsp:Transcript_5552/g.24671  ORF Transcript_5552/g.24671 Transcript_5552/m.24671 type:complete len:250 (-) Transcript_5552:295-1044(-)
MSHPLRHGTRGEHLGSGRAELACARVHSEVGQELDCGAVLLPQRLGRGVQLELGGIDLGQERVALVLLWLIRRRGHLGEVEGLAVGGCHRLGVHLRAADDKDLLDTRLVLGRGEELESSLEGGAEEDPFRENLGLTAAVHGRGVLRTGLHQGVAAAQDDVDAAGQGSELGRDGLPRLAAHDHGVLGSGLVHLGGDRLEVGHILGEVPGQATLVPDAHLALGGSHDHLEGANRGRFVRHRELVTRRGGEG